AAGVSRNSRLRGSSFGSATATSPPNASPRRPASPARGSCAATCRRPGRTTRIFCSCAGEHSSLERPFGPEPAGDLDHLGPDDRVDAPGQCLNERPAAGTVSVETELATEPVEAMEHVFAAVAELGAANDRRHSELALPEQRLRVDREPR